MKINSWLLVILFISKSLFTYAQIYSLDAQSSFGGEDNDNAYSLVETSDGGFMIVGSTNSNKSYDVPESNGHVGNGGSDFWVIKTDVDGNLEWSQTFGGSRDDKATSIAKTINGEYVIVGSTRSEDGDANFNGTNGGILMIRLKEDGTKVSTRIIAGGRRFTQDTYHYADAFAQPTVKVAMNGEIFIGGTYEIGAAPYRAKQFYLTKLTKTGDTLWEKYFGSDLDDQMSDFSIADNGDILMVGSTTAFAYQIPGAGNGNFDFLAIKVDYNGVLQWERAWGGSHIDVLHGVIEAHKHNGFVVVGETSSNNGIANDAHGQKDAFIFQISNDGNLAWKRQAGGDGNDNLFNIIREEGNKYLAFGTSDSHYQNVASKGPLTDVLTITIYENGLIENVGLFGGADIDVARAGVNLANGNWALAGISRSESEDVSKNNGENDFWVMQLSPPPPIRFDVFKGFVNLHHQGELTLKTNYQQNADIIRLEKSFDNKTFTKLEDFTANENTNYQSTYNYLDKGMNYGDNFYRIKFFDRHGKEFNGPTLLINFAPLATELEEKEEDKFKIYPNPTAEKINVPVLDRNAQFLIYDMFGKNVNVNPLYSPLTGWFFNLRHLKQGTYLLRITTESDIKTKRFVVR